MCKNCSLYTLLTAMDQKPQKSLKALLSVKHTNIDIQAMLVWLIVPFYDFYGFCSIAVNSVYKLQFFYMYST